MIANGHPDLTIHKHHPDLHFYEPMLLFEQKGGQWKNFSHRAGPAFSRRVAGRGLALGDFDNDGAVDVLVATNNGAPMLLRNLAGRENHWLGLRLVGTKSNIDAVGAKVTWQSGSLKRHRTKVGGGSYLSSHDPRMVLGLGPNKKVDWIEIEWPKPGGSTQRLTNLPVDRYITVVEGQPHWK